MSMRSIENWRYELEWCNVFQEFELTKWSMYIDVQYVNIWKHTKRLAREFFRSHSKTILSRARQIIPVRVEVVDAGGVDRLRVHPQGRPPIPSGRPSRWTHVSLRKFIFTKKTCKFHFEISFLLHFKRNERPSPRSCGAEIPIRSILQNYYTFRMREHLKTLMKLTIIQKPNNFDLVCYQ